MAPELRIGNAERERATAALNEHFAQGRLDHDEYGERLDAIWSARTRADLDQLFWDLPAAAPPVRVAPSAKRSRGPRPHVPIAAIAIGLILLGVAASLPLWILAVLLWVGACTFGGSHGGCRS